MDLGGHGGSSNVHLFQNTSLDGAEFQEKSSLGSSGFPLPHSPSYCRMYVRHLERHLRNGWTNDPVGTNNEESKTAAFLRD